jgi:hypothetical protein
MATLVTILDVEAEVERAWAAMLSAAPYSLSATGSDTAAALTTPRTEVKAEVLRWGPHQFTPTGGASAGSALYDNFLVRLSLDVVFQPEHAQGQGSIRGKLRVALRDWTRLKAAFATNGYLLVDPDSLRQTGGGRDIDDEEKMETIKTELEFGVWLSQSAVNAAT